MNTSEKGKVIYDLLVAHGLNPVIAKYTAAQSAHETGGFTSLLYLTNNNAFGMKYAGQHHALGERFGYAYYDSVDSSVQDIITWFSILRGRGIIMPVDSVDSYVHYLKANNYFEAPESEYLSGVKNFYRQLFPNG